jgi:hypothetical protein
MRDTFWQPPTAPAAPPAGRVRVAESSAESGEQAGGTDRVTAKTEPPTHVVDAWGRGDFTTVSAAIKAAKPGDRILVRPGLYEEGLVVDKPLEILGDGPVADIEIRARATDVLMFRASIGRVANLTLRQVGGKKKWFGVNITQGRLDLEGCDIACQSLACVAIRNGADPRLRRNKIHDSKERGGVFVFDGGWARWRTTTSPATATWAWRSRPVATPQCATTGSTTTVTRRYGFTGAAGVWWRIMT